MISKLIPGMTNVNLIAKVVSKGDRRNVNTRYGKSVVCDVVVRDETGEISLSLWNDQIDKVKEGDSISIKGAYTTEWQGEVKLNIPRRGSIEKVDE